MNFLYYIPGGRANQIDVDALGLRYAFERPPTQTENTSGPQQCGEGVLLSADDKAPKLKSAEQTWRKQGNIWIGYWNGNPPTEVDLRRTRMLDGSPIILAGQGWQVPIARTFDMDGERIVPRRTLSRYFDINDDGEICWGDVEEEYEPLWEVANRWWDFFYWSELPEDQRSEEDSKPDLLVTDLVEMAATVLQANYRVSKLECVMLKLLTKTSTSEILGATISLELLDELLKKNQPAPGSVMSSGDEALSTSPALQNS